MLGGLTRIAGLDLSLPESISEAEAMSNETRSNEGFQTDRSAGQEWMEGGMVLLARPIELWRDARAEERKVQ